MVYQPAQPSKIENKHKRSKALQVVLDTLTLLLVAGATYAIFRLTAVKPENRESNNPSVVSKVSIDEDEEEEEMWLERTLKSWTGTYSSDFSASVEVFDLDNEKVIGELSPEVIYTAHAESEMATVVGTGFATAGQTSARELVEILKLVFRHDGMSDEDWTAYKEKLLAQERIYSEERCQGYCEVRAGLPAGFKNEQVKVYNENYMNTNGSFFEAYRDAAIVEVSVNSERTRHFAVALVAKNFSFQTDFQKLGEMLERVILTHIENEI